MTQRNIKAVIFDCDGTLIDSEHAHYLSWKHAVQKWGGDLTLEEYASLYVGKSLHTNAAILVEKIQNGASIDAVIRDKREHYGELRLQGFPKIEATVAFLHQLYPMKESYPLKLGLASAASREEILHNLETLQVTHFFDLIISGMDDLYHYHDPEGVNKPKPYIYLEAASRLEVAPKECIVIEDSHVGVTAGFTAGCITVAVPNKYTSGHDFSKAHETVFSFAELDPISFLTQINNKTIAQ